MKNFFIIFILLIVGLILTACNPEETGVTTSPGLPTNPTGTATVTNPTSSFPELTGGGTLKLYGSAPYTLDPAVSSDANSSSYIIQIFNGLGASG